jgi:hypothetical protein
MHPIKSSLAVSCVRFIKETDVSRTILVIIRDVCTVPHIYRSPGHLLYWPTNRRLVGSGNILQPWWWRQRWSPKRRFVLYIWHGWWQEKTVESSRRASFRSYKLPWSSTELSFKNQRLTSGHNVMAVITGLEMLRTLGLIAKKQATIICN